MKRSDGQNDEGNTGSRNVKAKKDYILHPEQIDEVGAHANCTDGMGALFCSKLFEKIHGSKEIKTFTIYHDKPDDEYLKILKGDPNNDREMVTNVAIFDFGFNENVTKELLASPKHSIMIFDHHKGNKEVMEKFPDRCIFDNDRAGVHLAWDYFFPNIPYPKWANYIGIRDLGTGFENEDIAKFSAFLFYATELSVNEWMTHIYPNLDSFIAQFKEKNKELVDLNGKFTTRGTQIFHEALEESVPYTEFSKRGSEFLLVQTKMVNMQVKTFIRSKFCGLTTGVGNVHISVSECAVSFLKKNPDYKLVIMWHVNNYDLKYKFSIRSRKDDPDVNCDKIAKLFGGGGHESAAGFQIDLSQDVYKFLIENISNLKWKE